MADSKTDYAGHIAGRLIDESSSLCCRWLSRLEEFLSVSTEEIFPSDDLLDHVPHLIAAIAEDIGAPANATSSSLVNEKARTLGELRHAQDASVHQLLREYEYLAEILLDFVADETAALDESPDSAAVIDLLRRLDRSVRVLMRTTIDTYTAKFAETIDEQHERLSAFNRMLSHELRNPLYSLRLAADLLSSEAQTGASPADASTPPTHSLVRENVEQIVEILGAMERIAAGLPDDVTNPARQEIELEALVDDVWEELDEVADEYGVDLRKPPPGLPVICADVAKLRIVLSNLMANSIKYSDPDKSRRFVEVSVADDAPDDRLTLRIRDNGIGIEEDELPRVFEREYRGHSEACEAADGRGLGLFIVKEATRSMGGTVEARSERGRGTSVIVVLPQVQVVDAGAQDGPAGRAG